MRSIQELAAADNITDTATNTGGTYDMDYFRATFLDEGIFKYGEDFRFMQNVCEHNDVLTKARGYTVRLFATGSHLSITNSKTEGDERTYTEMTNLEYVDATPTWKFYAIAISKEVISNTRLDLVELGKYMVVQDVEQDIETAIATEMSTATTNIVYGGDASSAATLETGDVITTDMWANAVYKLRSINLKPFTGFINAIQEYAFIKDSQFVNASEYGDREVILNGEIGKYLGVKIVVTSNVPAKTNGDDSWGVDGHEAYMISQNQFKQKPVTIAWKEKAKYDYEYLKRFCNHYIYADICYDVQLVLEEGVCLMRSADA